MKQTQQNDMFEYFSHCMHVLISDLGQISHFFRFLPREKAFSNKIHSNSWSKYLCVFILLRNKNIYSIYPECNYKRSMIQYFGSGIYTVYKFLLNWHHLSICDVTKESTLT